MAGTDQLIQPAFNPLDLLKTLVGSQQNQDLAETGTKNTTATQNQTGSSNQNQSTTGSTATTGTATGTTNQTTTNTADIAALQQILGKQMGGISPEQLKSIFTQGAEQVPSLITAYANAMGARSSSNTPLATALEGLNAKLTQQAATINQQMLSDASNTAGKIASSTGSQSTTGTTNQATNQNTQALQSLVNALTSSQNTQQNSAENTTKNVKNDVTTTVDNEQLMKVLGVLGIYGALNGGMGSGLLGSLFGGITGQAGAAGGAAGAGGLLGAVKDLLTGGSQTPGAPMTSTDTMNWEDILKAFQDSNGGVGIYDPPAVNIPIPDIPDASFWDPFEQP